MTIPNFIDIGQTGAEIWQFNSFQDGILKFFLIAGRVRGNNIMQHWLQHIGL